MTLDDTVLTGGILLICSAYGLMLSRGAQQLSIEEDELVLGGRRVEWRQVQGLALVRGPESTQLEVLLTTGPVRIGARMVREELHLVAGRIVERAGLEHGELPTKLKSDHGGRLETWTKPLLEVEPEPELLEADTDGSTAEATPPLEELDPEVVARVNAGREVQQEQQEQRKKRKERKKRKQRKQPSNAKTRAGIGFAALAILAKFGKYVFVVLKFGGKALKLGKLAPTALTMLATVWIYAQIWGWYFAAGFVALLFIHEIGHAVIIAAKGIQTSPIMFVPFFGAFIGIKDQFRDAAVEAETALGGPALGALAATLSFLAYRATGYELWLVLAYSGFLLNLFNLLPVSPLDGGRIVTAISIWLWGVGLVLVGGLAFYTTHPILILVAILGALRAWQTFRGGRKGEHQAYYDVAPGLRVAMSVAYFGLAGYLGYMMQWSLRLLDVAV